MPNDFQAAGLLVFMDRFKRVISRRVRTTYRRV